MSPHLRRVVRRNVRGATAGLVAALLAAAALSGCSSDSKTKARAVPSPPKPTGEVAKPGATVIADARKALLAATSVHVTGSFSGATAATKKTPASSTQQQLDLHLSRGAKGVALATGSVSTVTTADGKSITVKLALVRVGTQLYIRGDKAYYARIGPKAAKVAGRWLALPISQDRSVADLSDISQLAAGLSGATSATTRGLTKLGTTTAVVVQTGEGAILYVAATGSPRPLRLQRPAAAGSSVLAGTLNFADYGEVLAIRAPSGAIAIAKVR